MVKSIAKKIMQNHFFKRFGVDFSVFLSLIWGKGFTNTQDFENKIRPISLSFDEFMNEWGEFSTEEEEFLSTSILTKGILSERLRIVAMLAVLDLLELKRIRQKNIDKNEKLMLN